MTATQSAMAIPPPNKASLPVVRTGLQGQPLDDKFVLELLKARYSAGYLFRGQTSRYFRQWPPESKPRINASAYMLDSIVPSDYRGVEEAIQSGRKYDNDVMFAYGDEVSHGRVALVQAGLKLLDALDGTGGITTWLNDLPNPNTNYFTSLGQHIGLPSQNTDLHTYQMSHGGLQHILGVEFIRAVKGTYTVSTVMPLKIQSLTTTREG